MDTGKAKAYLHQDFDEHIQVFPQPLILGCAATPGVSDGPTQLNGHLAYGDNIAQATKSQGSFHGWLLVCMIDGRNFHWKVSESVGPRSNGRVVWAQVSSI